MIVLDTNVVSAVMRGQGDDLRVVAWLDRQSPRSVCISSITEFEARLGIALLASGKRRDSLTAAFEQLLDEDLQRRVLPFDRSSASAAAELTAMRQRQGRPVDLRDTMIAGICIAHRATLATRNLRHFDDLPTPVVDPFSALG